MDTVTATVPLPAPAHEVFRYLSRIETVPEWATEFVQTFEVLNLEEARAVTSKGEVLFRVSSDPDTGVIDLRVGSSEDRMALFPTRVVPLSHDRSVYLFTMFRTLDQSEEQFRAEYESLRRELENVVRRFSHQGEADVA